MLGADENDFYKVIFSKEEELVKGDYENCNFVSCNFHDQDLSNGKFAACVFEGRNLSTANLNGTKNSRIQKRQASWLEFQ